MATNYWMDLAYYGLRFLILQSKGESFVVAAGDTATNEGALSSLGFRHSEKLGFFLRKGMPDAHQIKGAFPHMKWYVPDEADAKAIVLKAPASSVDTTPPVEVLRVASPREQHGRIGFVAAALLANLAVTEQLLASDDARVTLHVNGRADIVIEREPRRAGQRGVGLVFSSAPHASPPVSLILDGAGQLFLAPSTTATDGPTEIEAAAMLADVLLKRRNGAVTVVDGNAPDAHATSPAASAVDDAAPTPARKNRMQVSAADSTSIPVIVGTPPGGEDAFVSVTRWRVVGEGAGAQVFADAVLTRANGQVTRASALPVPAVAETAAALSDLVAAWGVARTFSVEYVMAAPSAEHGPVQPEAAADVIETAEKDSEHEQRSEHATDDAAGSAERLVPAHQDGDGQGARGTGDVPRSVDPEPTGDGRSPRARRRERLPVRRDDDTFLFGGLTDKPTNFRLTDATRLTASSWSESKAIERNLAALRALKRFGASAESADEADQDALIRYVGWGGLPGVFAPQHHLERAHGRELRELLGDDGFAAARASTVNAHYTAVPVVDAVWAAVQRAGFTGGRALEPGAGTGLFLARVPEAVGAATRFVAVEKDPTTGAILTALYPQARVHVAGYEETPIPNNSMDLVIGNVPFGEFRVYDEAYKTLKAPIHDYFLVKSLDKLKPGGVMACITSTGTLDKQNPRFREAMYEKADLIAACRLPDDTFSDNANTDVTTDVVFFRKRKADEAAQPFDWRDQVEIQGADGKPQWVNGIFDTDRGHLLGYAVTQSNMYGGARNVVVRKHPKTSAEWSMSRVLKALGQATPEGVWSTQQDAATVSVLDDEAATGGVDGELAAEQEGNYQVRNGVLGQITGGAFAKVTLRYKSDEARVRAWIPVRDAIKEVLRVQIEGSGDDESLRGAQATLALAYDVAVDAFGPVSLRANRRAMIDDPDLDVLLAAEDFDEETGVATKTEVFTERTLNRRGLMPLVETPTDALLWCIDQYARVIPERIADAANEAWEDCRLALRGQIFMDPDSGEFEIAARYLSGNVRAKLRTAERAAQSDPQYAENVAALKERVPSWLSAAEIDANLGQPWIAASDIAEFVARLYETRVDAVHVAHNPVTAEWALTIPKHLDSPRWSTPRFDAGELVELALRGQMPKAFDKDDEGRSVLNPMQTAIAIEKQKEIREEFGRWIWSDLERTARLESIYNEKFRSHRSPDYSGLPMTVPGMAATRKLRTHQERGVIRIVMETNTLLAHPVGYGKTATAVSAAMKLKSLQLANKSMVVVRKNTLYQAAAETKRWFPESRVLMIRSEDLNPKGRMQFWRRVQTRNADIILVTPEAFKRIRLPKDAEVRYLNEEVSRLEQALAHEAKTAGETGRPRTRQVKTLEKRREAATAKMKELLNLGEKDDGRITLADLGIDALFVDEAQNYKNLQVLTREQMLGIPTAAAQRASDLASKVWFLQQSNKRIVFMTGTPVVNTLAEIFNLQRYLSPGLLEEASLQNFDAWVAQFGEPVSSLEPDPGGAGFRTVRRLAEVRNVPELVAMFAQMTDAVSETSVDLGRPTPHFRTIASEPTSMQAVYREVLSERVVAIRNRSGRGNEKGADNILAVLGDARRAALDLRTRYPELPGALAGNKLAEVTAQVAAIRAQTTPTSGTQLVFLDFGTPGKGRWNAYDEIRDGLVALGVDRAEIAFIHDCKTDQAKADLFRHVRAGRVRVLLGSTEKMGEGTNVQDHLVALHHVNAPFHPGAVIQRNGRAIRQGNQNSDVQIITYVTQGLLEDWNWHLVLLKERFIRQLMDGIAANMDGEGLARRMTEDPSASMSYEDIEAMASGDPLVKEKCSVDAEIKRLRMLRDGHASTQGAIRHRLNSVRDALARHEREREWVVPIAAKVTPPPVGVPGVVVNGQTFTGEKAFVRAGTAVLMAIEVARKETYRTHVVADVMGLTAIMSSTVTGLRMELVASPDDRSNGRFQVDVTANPIAMIKRMELAAEEVRSSPARLDKRIADDRENIARYEAEAGAGWPQEDAYQVLLVRQREANLALEAKNAEKKTDQRFSATQEFGRLLAESGAVALATPVMDDEEIDVAWGGQSDEDDERSGADESDEEDRLPMAASAGMGSAR